MRILLALIAALSLGLLVACGSDEDNPQLSPAPHPSGLPEIAMTGGSFNEGGVINFDFSCDGIGKSPAILWHEVPVDAKSIVLFADDRDAGNFVHWVVYDIPPQQSGITAGIGEEPILGDGSHQGQNSYGRTGYAPPCPPSGSTHTYQFFAYALDTMLGLAPGATRDAVAQAMDGHIMALGKLTATYSRE